MSASAWSSGPTRAGARPAGSASAIRTRGAPTSRAGAGRGGQAGRDGEWADGGACAELRGELVELGRPRDGVRNLGVLDGPLLGELAGVVGLVDPVDPDDREHDVMGHALARPGLEEAVGGGAEELDGLAA